MNAICRKMVVLRPVAEGRNQLDETALEKAIVTANANATEKETVTIAIANTNATMAGAQGIIDVGTRRITIRAENANIVTETKTVITEIARKKGNTSAKPTSLAMTVLETGLAAIETVMSVTIVTGGGHPSRGEDRKTRDTLWHTPAVLRRESASVACIPTDQKRFVFTQSTGFVHQAHKLHSQRARYDDLETPRGAPPPREETPEEGEI